MRLLACLLVTLLSFRNLLAATPVGLTHSPSPTSTVPASVPASVPVPSPGSMPVSMPGTPTGSTVDKCSHSVCYPGPSLDPKCSDCAAEVIKRDSYCQFSYWDSACVSEVALYCPLTSCTPAPIIQPSSAPASVCVHSECVMGIALLKGCDPCVDKVLAFDLYCSVVWDSWCVNEVSYFCSSSCLVSTGTPSLGPTPSFGPSGTPSYLPSATYSDYYYLASTSPTPIPSALMPYYQPSSQVGSCSHSKCFTGQALVTGCDSCVDSIIAGDPYCRATYWDSICVGEVTSICQIGCANQSSGTPSSKPSSSLSYTARPTSEPSPFVISTSPTPIPTPLTSYYEPSSQVGGCSHSKCFTGQALVTGCDSCVDRIIAGDPYCRATYWDSICVGEVTSICQIGCANQSSGTPSSKPSSSLSYTARPTSKPSPFAKPKPATPPSSNFICAHSICQVGVALDPACDKCVAKIGAQDGYCLKTQWDSTCVAEVLSICSNSVCFFPPSPSEQVTQAPSKDDSFMSTSESSHRPAWMPTTVIVIIIVAFAVLALVIVIACCVAKCCARRRVVFERPFTPRAVRAREPTFIIPATLAVTSPDQVVVIVGTAPPIPTNIAAVPV
jgi:hypothetical protein